MTEIQIQICAGSERDVSGLPSYTLAQARAAISMHTPAEPGGQSLAAAQSRMQRQAADFWRKRKEAAQ